jgi:hypothetical protein
MDAVEVEKEFRTAFRLLASGPPAFAALSVVPPARRRLLVPVSAVYLVHRQIGYRKLMRLQ